MKKNIISAAILIVIIPLDYLTKSAIVNHFSAGQRLDYLGGFLRIALVYNEGGVFGILQGYKNVFLVFSVIVLIIMFVYYFYEKNKTYIFTTAMALIMSGAVGNIIDRLIPGRPGVVDFISVGVDGVYRWPSFNVADSVIVAGAFLLVIMFIMEERKKKQAG